MKSENPEMNSLKQKLAVRTLFWVMLFCFMLSLIPILLPGRYCTPWADDYVYGFHTHKVFLESDSLRQTVTAAVEQVKNSYYAWQGTCSAIFLMTLQPAVFGERFYALVPWIMMFSLMLGTGLFVLSICSVAFRFKWEIGGIIVLVLGLLRNQLVHSPVNIFTALTEVCFIRSFWNLAGSVWCRHPTCRKRWNWPFISVEFFAVFSGGW